MLTYCEYWKDWCVMMCYGSIGYSNPPFSSGRRGGGGSDGRSAKAHPRRVHKAIRGERGGCEGERE